MIRTITQRDEERSAAIVRLLALKDPDDLRDRRGNKRGYRYTQTRPRHASPDVIKRDLGTAYVAHRRQELGTDISCIVSKRTYALRLVKTA